MNTERFGREFVNTIKSTGTMKLQMVLEVHLSCRMTLNPSIHNSSNLRLGRVPHSTVKVIAVIMNVILATGLQSKQYGSIFRFVAPHCRGL